MKIKIWLQRKLFLLSQRLLLKDRAIRRMAILKDLSKMCSRSGVTDYNKRFVPSARAS